jgi:hypothetical protein
MFKLSVTPQDGTVYSYVVERLPGVPYGTDFYGNRGFEKNESAPAPLTRPGA